MSKYIKEITCFISSPGDCVVEREICDRVLQNINKSYKEHYSIEFKSFKWENDVLPDMGVNGQETIDNDVSKSDYDIFIGIMKNKFGHATTKAESGTVHEFNDALKRKNNSADSSPRIIFFFGKENVDLNVPNSDDVIAQHKKVKEFKSSLQDQGLYVDFEGNNHFEEKLTEKLKLILKQIAKEENICPNEIETKIELSIETDFEEFLNDIGANFTHRSKEVLHIDDLYVMPFLEKFSFSDSEDKVGTLTTQNIFDGIVSSELEHLILLGEESSGKTTFSKVLYKLLFKNGLVPVYIKGRDIKQTSPNEIKKQIEREFHKQYNENLKNCIDTSIIIIIDDFNSCTLKPKYKKNFLASLYSISYRTVITWDEFFTLSELFESKTLDVNIYELIKFGAKKRFELIKKWTDLFADEFEDEASKMSHIYQLEKIVDSVLGKNLVPSFPIYILTILQANELTSGQNLEQSTFGHYYDVLIKSALGQKVKENKEIEKYYSYLTELSYWMFKNNTISLDEEQVLDFHNYFQKEYKLKSSFLDTFKTLLETNVLIKTNDNYKFKYKYIYFYFIGKYFSDNIEEENVKQIVSNLSKRLYQTDCSNIYMFLSHHSRSKFVINQIIINAKEIFNEQKILNFKEDVKEINGLIEETSENINFDTSITVNEYKNEELETKEKNENVIIKSEDLDYNLNEDPNEIDSISKINKSFKTVEILGYIVKNRYASLKGNDKEEIVEELYVLGLKTLSFIFKTLLEGEEYINNEIIDLIKNDSSSNLTAREKEVLAKQFMFNLLYMVSYSILKKISSSISTKDLQITFDDLREKYKDNNAVGLIDIAVKFDYFKEFPYKDTSILVEEFKNNKLSFYILRRLGINFMRMIPMKEQEQQRVGNLLDISIKSQRLIGGTSTIRKSSHIKS